MAVCCAGLAACGGGSGGSGSGSASGTGAAAQGTTPTLLSGSMPAAVPVNGSETALSGGSIVTNGGIGTFFFAETLGKRANGSEAVTLRDANYTFVSDGSVDAQGRLTDANGAWIRYIPLSDNYAGSRIYEGGYVSDGGAATAVFFGSIGAPAPTVPTMGTVTYAGEAFGTFTSPSSAINFDARSRAFADFAAGGNVDLIIDDISATNRSTGAAVNPAFSEVRILGMDVSGTTYTGGALETLSNIAGQPPVNLFGAGVRAAAQGEFYGGPEAGQPAATAGTFAITGFTGSMTGAWVGNRKQ